MNSRERVRLAINHREADRIPIDFGAMRSTGINGIAYANLLTYLKKNETIKLYDIWQQLAEPSIEMADHFHADVVQLHQLKTSFGIRNDQWKPGLLTDGRKCMVPQQLDPVVDEEGNKLIVQNGVTIAKMPKGGLYYDIVYHPCADVQTVEDIDRALDFPVMTDEEAEFVRKQAAVLYDNSDKAILGAFGGSIYENGQYDFDYLQYYVAIAGEPDLIHYYNQKKVEAYLKSLEKYLQAVGGYIDVIHFGDDLGTQINSQISEEMYRSMIQPYHKKMFDYVHSKRPDLKVFFHSCGAIFKLIPALIEAGVDILNPVQLTASGMDPQALKDSFGDRLTFWGGGCNTATTATQGSPEDIEEEVRKLVGIFKPDGGFVFTQVHNIQANVPPENIVSIYESAYKYGGYDR